MRLGEWTGMRLITDLYDRGARRYPDRECFVFGETRRTYRDYAARGRQLGSAIERSGLEDQDRVGIFATNSIEYFEMVAGCEYGRFVAVMMNFRSAPPELEYMLEHSDPRILVFDEPTMPVVEAVRAGATGIRRYIYIATNGTGPCPDWATPFEAFMAEGDPAGPERRPQNGDHANLFYTSGTTGRPKGVPYDHAALINTALRNVQEEDCVMLQATPLFHVGGRLPPLGAMFRMGKAVITQTFDPVKWMETVQNERITVTFMVPVMMLAVLDHPDFGKYDLSSLRWVMAASTAIPPPLLTRAIEAFGPVFYIAYGSTEGGAICRMRKCETRADGPPEQTARLASVGHPEIWADVLILDDDGNEVPEGTVGEICVHSLGFRGYWRDEKATKEAMFGRYFRTGDMGYRDDRDYVYLVDRKKDMIISGGENIYSREVEDALLRHNAVQQAAVIGMPDERWGETVVAVVILKPGETVSEEELIEFSKTQLARYKCPKQVHFTDALPMSGTNKIDKVALRRTYAGKAPA